MFECQSLVNAIDAYIAKAEGNLEDVLGSEGYVDAEETAKRISEIEQAVAEALDKETELFISAAKDSKDLETFADEILPGIKHSDSLASKVTEIFQEQFSECLPLFGSMYLAQTDKGLVMDTLSNRTTAWVKNWSEELGEIMQLNSHTEIENILTTGLSEGYGVQKFVENILDSGIRDSHYKARRVAVTEVLRAHSVAHEESIQQSPAVTHKQWMHTGSYRNMPRQNHIDMNEQIVPKDESFTLIGADGGVYFPEYPRDICLPASESINCHCTHTGIVDDIGGLSLEERKQLQAEAIAEMDDEWERELDAQNKAKAGITSDEPDSVRGERTELGRLDNFTKEEQVKYMGGQQKWALYESGIIKDDEMLLKIKSSNLTELNNDGIITIGTKTLNHSNVGEFTVPTAAGIVRHRGGSHGQDGLNECALRGVKCDINGTYNNGVRVGDIPTSKQTFKQSGSMQSWFPDSWTADDIRVAGTYVANSEAPLLEGYHKTVEYKGVAVRILIDTSGKVTAVCPDLDQTIYVEGVKLI